jgi:hypothetical protein
VQVESQIAEAVKAGVVLDEIEATIIDRAQLDEEYRSALWLYAEALEARRIEERPIDAEFAPH